MQLELQRRYHATVEEVHSGDDLILMVELGHDSLFKRVRVRLQGVDTPDAYKADATTEAGRIRDQVRSMTKDKKCVIEVHSNRKGGWIVTLFIRGANDEFFDLNKHLKDAGFVFNTKESRKI